MKKSLILFFAVFAFSAIIISSCKKDKKVTPDDPTPDCVVENMSFTNDITPIMNQNCNVSGCHDNVTVAAGIKLDNYTGVHDNADKIVLTINHSDGVDAMPPNADKIDACDIKKIEAWISQGKKDN